MESVTICGIPAQVKILYYQPPEQECPDQPGCGAWFDYRVYDRRGYPAPWLQRKMRARDEDNVQAQLRGELT